MIQIGSVARLIQPVVQGEVVETRYSKDAGELEHLISFTDAAGEAHERWFPASHLEAVQ